MRILCAGSLALNDTVFADGRTTMADPGGNALYATVGASLMSDQVSIAAVVGADWPEAHTRVLREHGVDTEGLIFAGAETMRTWTLYEHSGLRRYLFRNSEVAPLTPDPFRGALAPEDLEAWVDATRRVHRRCAPRPVDVPLSLDAFGAIHLAPMPLDTLVEWTAAAVRRPGRWITLDPPPFPARAGEDPRLAALLRPVDVFMPSEVEARSIAPELAPEAFARRMAALGPRAVVVKLGERGAVMYDRARDRVFEIDPVPVEVKDPTGAGDAFAGGFAAGLVATGDPAEAARWGTAAASAVIEGSGALHALAFPAEEARRRRASVEVRERA